MRLGTWALLVTLTAACTTPAPDDMTVLPVDTGDLVQPVVADVAVDGTVLRVAVAATAAERRRGLRGVDDLGDLDGMLFTWDGDTVSSTFTMQDTVIPLDIWFFDADGILVDVLRMTPCEGSDCVSYAADAQYSYALESPAGSLAPPPAGARIVVGSGS